MLFLQKTIKPLVLTLSTILILTLIVTIFNYFNIINFKIIKVLKIIIPLIATFIGGFIIGVRSDENGWLAGIKYGLIFLVLLLLFNVLALRYKIQLKDFIYYLILLLSTTVGSMIGINTKKNNE